jgi:hypothetical protein
LGVLGCIPFANGANVTTKKDCTIFLLLNANDTVLLHVLNENIKTNHEASNETWLGMGSLSGFLCTIQTMQLVQS